MSTDKHTCHQHAGQAVQPVRYSGDSRPTLDYGQAEQPVLRREFLSHSAFGIGAFALAHLLQRDGLLAETTGKPGENLPLNLQTRAPHFAPKANAMISLFMHGGPSHVDLLDPKPELTKHHGAEYGGDVVYSFVNRANKKLFGTPFKFAKHGQCGTDVSELLPEIAGIVDDIAVLRSMHTGHNGHEVSIRYFHGGIAGVTGRPTMGSWLVYALGSESQNLPAYMVLSDPGGHPVDGTHNWSSGFMPPLYQGTVLRPQEPRILNLDAPPQLRGTVQAQNLEFLNRLNRRHQSLRPGEADLETRIQSYELAAAMQTAAKEALDISQEPEHIHKLYGLDEDATREYGTRCLLARRLVERGVRFVQLFLGGQPWDNHQNIRKALPDIAHRTDKPAAALVKDLKRHDDRPLGGRNRPPPGDRRNPRRHRRPRPQRPGLLHLAGRRRNQRRIDVRRNRRSRPQSGGECRDAQRLPGHPVAPPRPRPRQTHLPLQRPRTTPHRRPPGANCAGNSEVVGQIFDLSRFHLPTSFIIEISKVPL
jgi:hypothetical protein